LLALGNERVDGKEGTLVGVTVATTKLEGDGGVAETEVGSLVACAGVVVVVVVVIVVVVLVLAHVDNSGRSGSREESKDKSLGVHGDGKVVGKDRLAVMERKYSQRRERNSSQNLVKRSTLNEWNLLVDGWAKKKKLRPSGSSTRR